MIEVTDEMIEAAEQVEDLYRRGTPDTWKKVYIAMHREALPVVDCRTCNFTTKKANGYRGCLLSSCTNGNQYQPAPTLMLWRK